MGEDPILKWAEEVPGRSDSFLYSIQQSFQPKSQALKGVSAIPCEMSVGTAPRSPTVIPSSTQLQGRRIESRDWWSSSSSVPESVRTCRLGLARTASSLHFERVRHNSVERRGLPPEHFSPCHSRTVWV